MKRKWLLVVLWLILLSVIACSPQQVIQKPEFLKITDVEILDVNKENVIIRVRTLFRNPNAFGCVMENITFSTIIDGQPLGASRIQGTVNINGNENFELLLDSRLVIASIPKVVTAVLVKPDVEVEVKGQTTLVTALKNMTFSFNPKSRVEIKNRMKNMIRMKLFSKLTEIGLVSFPASITGEQP
jgi:LEA14-like dessication related protein